MRIFEICFILSSHFRWSYLIRDEYSSLVGVRGRLEWRGEPVRETNGMDLKHTHTPIHTDRNTPAPELVSTLLYLESPI